MNDLKGEILVHHRYNDLGQLERVDFEWRGGRYATIDTRFAPIANQQHWERKGDKFMVGQYPVRIMDYNAMSDQFLVVRDGLFWWVFPALWMVVRGLETVYRRLILTAVVWHLADHSTYTSPPSWRDLKIVKWFAERAKKA